MSQRVVIDSSAFARESASLEGEVAVADLARLLDTLTNNRGSLKYRIYGGLGSHNRPQLTVKVDGALSLRCQRCLEGISYPVKLRSVLEFVDNEEDLTQEEIEDDSRDFLQAQSELDVVDLIEDEIILDLPSAPRHENCALPEIEQEQKAESPFALLKNLKSKA